MHLFKVYEDKILQNTYSEELFVYSSSKNLAKYCLDSNE